MISPVGYHFLEFPWLQGFADQITLHLVAAVVADQRQLLLRFNSHRIHFHLQVVRHAYDGIDQHQIIGVRQDVLYETSVDLQFADGELLHPPQGGHTDPEVIDGKSDSQLGQAANFVIKNVVTAICRGGCAGSLLAV